MRWLKKLMHRRRLARDLEDELQFHLDMKARAVGGVAARRAFGNPTAIQEVLRDMWTFPSFESWWRDIRYAVRSLAGSPGFTAVAVAALALGIGADTAMFTIIKGPLTWNFGLDHPGRILIVNTTNSAERRTDWVASYPDFRDFRARMKTLEGLAAYRMVPSNIADSVGFPERFLNVQISANGFRVAEIKPALGRDFIEADEASQAAPVVMISHHLWQQRYGGDPHIVGKVMRVDEVPREIIGVMAPDRRFPEETDVWTPLPASENRGDRRVMMFGRMPEGGNLKQVRAEADTIGRALAAQYPGSNQNLSASVEPIAAITGVYGMRPLLGVLFAAVGLVLLIACADVANMLLARGSGRVRELAIRVAIGAGRGRIFRQLLVEGMVLGVAGGVCGWLVAIGGLKWFDVSVATLDKPIWLSLTLDRGAFGYMAAISIGAGVLSGLMPSWRLMAQTGINGVLKDGGLGSAGGRSTSRLAGALVAFQMIQCVVLLAGAGLMIRSANRMYEAPVGAVTSNILTSRINLPEAKYPQPGDRIAFHRSLQAELEVLPGVVAAALASSPPLGGWNTYEMQLQSETATRRLDAVVATPEYFTVFGLKPVMGRLFDKDEALVNQSFAAKYWPNEAAVGKHVRLGKDWLTVSGVIPDVLQNIRDRLEHHPLLYLPYALKPEAGMFVLLRTQVPAATLANPLRAAVQKVDPNLPLFRTIPLEERLESARLEVTTFGSICSVFAGVALILATVGLYSVVAHSVTMRSQEIALRMAMGGTARDIIQLIFNQGMRPLLIGLALGVPLAMGAMSVLKAGLVGVTPTDPVTFASVILVLLIAGVLGCVIPARRATRVDPVVALRCQ